MIYLIKIEFLELRLLDIIDILLVGILIYQLYRLLKGTLAFNIFIGLLFIYLISLLVGVLDMHLLSSILGQFIDVGVILLLIVFQPEIRRFLVFVGRGNLLKKGTVWRKYLSSRSKINRHDEEILKELKIALANLSSTKTGAIIVISGTSGLRSYADTGVEIGAQISAKMLESIFVKKSPLHDGAAIISNNKVMAANCVLPVSENSSLPRTIGMRHRSAVGISEISDVLALIVSEEKGYLSYAYDGKLILNVSIDELIKVVKQFLEDELE